MKKYWMKIINIPHRKKCIIFFKRNCPTSQFWTSGNFKKLTVCSMWCLTSMHERLGTLSTAYIIEKRQGREVKFL